jgi:exonuclease 3'-5' domain-containing protein 1
MNCGQSSFTLDSMTRLNVVMVSTADNLRACLEAIYPNPSSASPVHIAVDIEGVALGRKGRIAIIQLLAKDGDTVWLIDVTTLGSLAFNEADSQGRSLRGILEGQGLKKVSRARNLNTEIYDDFLVFLRCTQ